MNGLIHPITWRN